MSVSAPTLRSELCARLGILYPVVQEGLGPYKTVHLAASVSNAGGLGTLCIPPLTLPPDEGARVLREYIEETCQLTDRPFAVNVPVGVGSDGQMLPFSRTYVDAVVGAVKDPAIAARLRVITTSAGAPSAVRSSIADTDLLHMHKVGGTRQALRAQAEGVDVSVASGYEAGGHTHARPVHTMVLAPNVIQAVDIPVVVAGGIRDGSTMAAALALGADAVALGTRFVATTDNRDWHPNYACAVRDFKEGEDVTVQAIYGPSRMLDNEGARELSELNERADLSHDAMTAWKDERLIAAQRDGDVVRGIAPIGQVASGIHDIVDVAEFLPRLVADAIEVLRRTADRVTSQQSV